MDGLDVSTLRIPRLWEVSVWGDDFACRMLTVCACSASEAEAEALMATRYLDLEWCDIRAVEEWSLFPQGDDYGIGDDLGD